MINPKQKRIRIKYFFKDIKNWDIYFDYILIKNYNWVFSLRNYFKLNNIRSRKIKIIWLVQYFKIFISLIYTSSFLI